MSGIVQIDKISGEEGERKYIALTSHSRLGALSPMVGSRFLFSMSTSDEVCLSSRQLLRDSAYIFPTKL